MTGTSATSAGLSVLNSSPTRLPGPSLLHHLVQLEPCQGAPAIHHLSSNMSKTTLTYRAWHTKADALAARLYATVHRDRRSSLDDVSFIVPVLLPQGPELYVALLAILKAGGAFCPLNLDAPPERIRFILEDVSAKVVVTTKHLASRIPRDSQDVTVLEVDAPDDCSSTLPPTHSPASTRQARPSDLAYVMYTSGSTGTPKGVGISHDAATQSLLAHDEHIPIFRRFLQFAAPTFDVSVFEIFFPLFRGATLVSADRRLMLDDLAAVIREMEVDGCELTPTVAGSLLRKRANAPSLRLLLTIGEMLTGPVVEEFGGNDGGRESILWAMYGPTEATIHCTLQPAFRADSTVNTIGFPLRSVSAFVLSIAKGNPEAGGNEDAITSDPAIVPIGEVGELAVGGFQLAEGYINRPEQTAAAFINTKSYGRLYRTGDKARLRPDGILECLGRISEGQVKLRGQRIELGEIEAAVLRVEGCHGAVAAVIDGRILVVFCLVDKSRTVEGVSPEERVLRACSDWLPQFMLPNDVVVLAEFPQLPSGKVDRKRMVAEYQSTRNTADAVVDGASAPDQLERSVCELAGSLLGATIKPSSDLASTGLDSILSIKLASLLRESGLRVDTIDVLRSRTVSQLCAGIRKLQANSQHARALDNVPIEIDLQQVLDQAPSLLQEHELIEAVLPCTPLQASMLAETAQDPQAYHNWIELELPADCSPEQIWAAFEELGLRNEILRTGFVHLDGRFVQVLWRRPPADPNPGGSRRAVTGKESPSRLAFGSKDNLLHPIRLQIVRRNAGLRASLEIHHALYDGWSMDMLLCDLDLLLRGEAPVPRPQFRSVVQYYHSAIYRAAADDARAFWAQQLLGFQPSPFPLLVPTAEPETQKTRSCIVALGIEPDRLKRLSSKVECSTQVVFQACLVWLWSSLLGVDDVVIGSVTSGRTIPVPTVEEIIGPCLASVPVRTKLRELRSPRELLAYLHAANRALLPHSILPLGEIKRSAGLLPTQSLYDVLFVYQESLASSIQRDACRVRETAHQDYLETKLLVEVEPTASAFNCRITHHVESVPSDFVHVFSDQFRCVLNHIMHHLDDELSSVHTAFPDVLLSQHNIAPASLDECVDLARLVEETAAESPDRPALCFAASILPDGSMNCRTLNYRELNSLANRMGRLLQDSGVDAGNPVAIIMEKSINLYAGILGILKSGCSYLPLLPTTPLQRIKSILAQSGTRICVTDTSAAQMLEPLGSSFRLLDLQVADLEHLSDANLDVSPDPARLAYVIYTSGTTGTPKGVCLTQRNICSNLDVLSRVYPLRSRYGYARLLQSCSQAFDVSVFEIFFAWKTGMCLCSATNDTLFVDLEHAIRALRITHLSMTPTVAHLINPSNVPAVEFLVTAGEPMTDEVARKWVGLLYQGYGPSETTNICTVKKMSHAVHIRHLGHGLNNTSSFVFRRDAAEGLVPIGCVGELCFGGEQVAQGYLGLPELTAEKFIEHPRYGRIYRTGDLGRMLPDGSLVIIGRVDDQIKLRGQRLELAEIDSVVREAESTAAALTLVVRRQEADSDQLATFYVPFLADSKKPGEGSRRCQTLLEDGSPFLTINQGLFRLLSSRLPNYMVPSYLIAVSEIPLMPSGKVDKAMLLNLFVELGQATLELASPGVGESTYGDEELSELEHAIAQAVVKQLKLGEMAVRRWTPFASLGLDSISAIGLVRRLRESLGVQVAISQVLQSACVARLAEVLDTSMGPLPHTISPQRDAVEFFDPVFHADIRKRFSNRVVETVLPCTPLQEGMLAASRRRSGANTSYLNQMVFKLAVSHEQMRACWDVMVRRHAILRTCFQSTEMARHPIVQVVLKDWAPSWHSFDIPTNDTGMDECVRSLAGTVAPAIDSMEPPLSLAVARWKQEEFLVFTCHHALYDGVAVTLLAQEVESLLLLPHCELQTSPQFGPFIREVLDLPESANAFWKERLSGFQPRSLPSPSAPGAEDDLSLDDLQLGVSLEEVNSQLKEIGASLLSLCQASWFTTLNILLESTDVCFGNVVSGRSVPVDRVDELVAPCFNTVPVRVDTADARHYMDLIRSLHGNGLETLQYQFTPLRRIQSLVTKTTGNVPLFDTLLLLQHPPRPLDQSVWTLVRDDGAMDVPLVCEVIPEPRRDALRVKLHHDTNVVSTSLVSFVFRLFSYAFATALRYPSARILTRATLPHELSQAFDSLELHHNIAESPSHRSDSACLPADDAPSATWTASQGAIRSVLATLSATPESNIRHHTTIYQLGLDSISAVQIAAALRRRNVAISATDVMEHPTCAELGAFIDRTTRDVDNRFRAAYDLAIFQAECQGQLSRSLTSPEVAVAILPCTPLQHGMLTEFITSDGHNYFNFLHLRPALSSVSIAAILAAWKLAVSRHDMLRTGFIPVEHRDFSFAMVRYSEADPQDYISIVEPSEASSFSAKGWRTRTREDVYSNLHLPPWRLALLGDDAGVMSMHLAMHHALYDAQSLQFILDDVFTAVSGGTSTAAPSPSIDAAVVDIVTHARANKSNVDQFWQELSPRTVINRFPVMTPLRVEHRNICVQTTRSDVPRVLLHEAVKTSGVSIQALIQAAWTRVLCSYLGEPSVVFGVVLSGRNTDAAREAVFPCITTLPVISENRSSNVELLQQMTTYNAALHRYQHTPLTQIQSWLGLPETRLFDTLLVYQKLEASSQTTDGQVWETVDETATVDYPISLEIEPRGNSLCYQLTFYDDVIPEEQALLLLKQFDAEVTHLAFSPNAQEGDLWSSSPSLFSITPAPHPELSSPVTTLHQFLENIAQLTPDRTALEFVSAFGPEGQPLARAWTYRELDANGNRIASLLESHTQTGGIVAVCFDKCPEAYFSILGVLKAGCAFVALDPGAPPARRQFILQDSGASALLTDKNRAAALDFVASVPVIPVDEEIIMASPPHPLIQRRSQLSPTDRCYCLYTSGTTGTPKGCEITHENAVQAMLAFQELFAGHWDPDSRWLQFASFHFDVSVLEQYWTWSVGIALVAAPRDLILEDLVATISRLQITHIDLTPSLARLVHPEEVPSLCRGVFITGGEQLKQEILDVWGDHGVIYNAYGPTEATIGVTAYQRVPRNGRPSNIGKQFLNVGSYVFKPGTETPVLRGGVGELCVSGKLVGRGYLNRDDLTAQRFPVLRQFGWERIYRTGDLVRILHDGCFDFLGRADDQIKLRGQRLEIGEINHAIRAGLPEVEDVATLVIRDEKKQKDFLVSFVVDESASDDANTGGRVLQPVIAAEGSPASSLPRDVQEACRAKLPGYMVPTYVVRLPFIPLSSNNKAEVKELRALFNSLTQEQLITAAGAGQRTEPTLSGGVARQVLSTLRSMHLLDGNDDLSADTSIFELGIDSISVLRFSRALKRGGLDRATPALVLKHPGIGDLVQALQTEVSSKEAGAVLEARQLVEACQHRNRAQACRILGVSSDQIEYIAPCSALQQGMISISKNDESNGAYFNVFTFELHGDVDLPRLKASWQTIVDSFSILRTRFLGSTEGFVQVALKDCPLPWTDVEIVETNSQGSCSEATLQAMYQDWVHRNSKDLVEPMELLLVKTSAAAKKTLLRLHIFHGLYDANSLGMIIAKAAALYLGTEPIESRTTFIDALIHGPLRNFNHTRIFWEDHLHGAELIPLPPLSSTPSRADTSSSRSLDFSPLEPARQRLRVTHSAVVQALWLSVLSMRYRGPFTVGIIVFGRAIDVENAEHVVGPLFNTLPFHLAEPPESQTWVRLVERCHNFSTATLPFQHTPLRDIQKWCAGGRPLFDTLFSCQRESLPSAARAGGLWTEVAPSALNADYPLAFEATLTRDNRMELLLVAQGGVADEASLATMLDEFEAAMARMAGDVDAPVTQAPGGTMAGGAAPGPRGRSNGIAGPHSAAPSAGFEWTPTASILRSEIAALAGVSAEDVTENTGLLELGLDSIDTIKLSARLKKVGIVLTNSQLVKGQTIMQFVSMPRLAAGRRAGEGDGNSNAELQVSKTAAALNVYLQENPGSVDLSRVEAVLPPTPLQDAMVADMLDSSFRRYFNHDVLELPADVDLLQLQEAWQTVVDASPVLRTGFVHIESTIFDFAFCQVVLKETRPPWEERQVASKADLQIEMERARARAEDAAGASHLLQLTLVHLEGRNLLILSIAHALYDGWSLDLLHRDVRDAYMGCFAARPSYVEYLDHMLLSAGPEAKDFWVDSLTGAVPTILQPRKLQVGTVKHPEPRSRILVHRMETESSVSATDLLAFCRRQAASLQVVGQICWAAVLSRRTQSLDVTFGSVLSGRETDVAEELLFPTMNTVAIRAVLHGTVGSLLRYCQENMAAINQFQHFPLRRAQRLGGIGAGSEGLFNTLFIMQKRRGISQADSGAEQGASIMESVDGASSVEYPVCVEMEVVGSSVIWRTACDDYFLTEKETHQLLQEVDVVLGFLLRSSSDTSIFNSSFSATDTGRADSSAGEVSVCGLPPFRLKARATASSATEVSAQTDTSTLVDEEWSALEELIRDVLAQVSGTLDPSTVRKTYNLYNLGLDSISAIKVSSLLRKQGVELRVRDLLGADSLEDMAAIASRASSKSANGSGAAEATSATSASAVIDDATVLAAVLEQVNVNSLLNDAGLRAEYSQELLPASPMQVHMISAWQNSGGEVFFPEFRYELLGTTDAFDVEDIRASWLALIREIPMLRTVFLSTGVKSMPFVQVLGPADDRYSIETFGPGAPFPGGDGPVRPVSMLSMPLVRLDATKGPLDASGRRRWMLLLKIHHALYDGFSLPEIIQRFQELLSCADKGTPQTVAPSTPAEWRGFLAQQVAPPTVDARKAFWTDYLLGACATPFNLTVAGSHSRTVPVAGSMVSKFTPGALKDVTSLRNACATSGITIQSLFLAAVARWMLTAERPRDTDVVFGVYLANRQSRSHHPDDHEAGRDPLACYPTLSLLPLRVCRRTIQAGDLVTAKAIQQDLREISSPVNSSVGLWEIKEWTGIQIDCFVNFLALPSSPEAGGGKTGTQLKELHGDPETDMCPSNYRLRPRDYPWLENNVARDAFPNAVDIEAALNGSGGLDVGVFGPVGLLHGEAGAENMISCIVGCLNGTFRAA